MAARDRHTAQKGPGLFPDTAEGTVPAHVETRLTEWLSGLASVHADWRPVVDAFLAGPEGQQLARFVRERIDAGAIIYPPLPLRALALTPLSEVRVVILGQDPYHGPGQAEGLAFSVAPGVRIPPSLRNIFLELQRDVGVPPPENGSLVRWARQGVLLLNTCLTVEDGAPASHAGRGWEALTDVIVRMVAQRVRPAVFMLWGAHAQAKAAIIAAAAPDGRHTVLKANHPSPLSARRPPVPFLGCGHFGQAEGALANSGAPPVAW
jgi:uracil-DNA glycosylase